MSSTKHRNPYASYATQSARCHHATHVDVQQTGRAKWYIRPEATRRARELLEQSEEPFLDETRRIIEKQIVVEFMCSHTLAKNATSQSIAEYTEDHADDIRAAEQARRERWTAALESAKQNPIYRRMAELGVDARMLERALPYFVSEEE